VKESKFPRLTSKCFETGRRSQTQSSVQALGAETVNGCLVLDRPGITAERHQLELNILTSITYALLPSAPGELLPS
jgi:hypothetical protein